MEYRYAAAVEDMPVNSCRAVEIDGRYILLARLDDGFHAIENRCSHAGARLDTRKVYRGGQVQCPVHGARFDLRTGAAKSAPAFRGLATFPVRVVEGKIEIGVPPRPAPMLASQAQR